MTNSETQTKSRAGRGPQGRSASARETAGSQGDEPRSEAGDGGQERDSRMLIRGALAAIVVIGWLGILHINRWFFGPPVLFLCTGWLAVVLTARFLWNAGMTAAYDEDSDIEDEEFWKPVGKRDELLREKRALLKAIKEIEFDREMGKMSDRDADELMRFYRARAIQVIKALEAEGDDRELSIEEKIDREVKARLSVASASSKAKSSSRRSKGKASKGNGKAEASAAPGDAEASKGNGKAEDSAEARGEAEDSAEARAEAEARGEAEDSGEAEDKAGDDGVEIEAEDKAGDGAEAGGPAGDNQDSADEADSAASEPARASAEVGS